MSKNKLSPEDSVIGDLLDSTNPDVAGAFNELAKTDMSASKIKTKKKKEIQFEDMLFALIDADKAISKLKGEKRYKYYLDMYNHWNLLFYKYLLLDGAFIQSTKCLAFLCVYGICILKKGQELFKRNEGEAYVLGYLTLFKGRCTDVARYEKILSRCAICLKDKVDPDIDIECTFIIEEHIRALRNSEALTSIDNTNEGYSKDGIPLAGGTSTGYSGPDKGLAGAVNLTLNKGTDKGGSGGAGGIPTQGPSDQSSTGTHLGGGTVGSDNEVTEVGSGDSQQPVGESIEGGEQTPQV